MTKIASEQKINTYAAESKKKSEPKTKITAETALADLDAEIKDVYVSAKKKRGLIAKFYGFVNKFVAPGLSDNKVYKKIEAYKAGKASKEEVKSYIDRYENANFNSTEITTDVIAGLSSIGGVGFLGKKTKTLIGVFAPKYKKHAALITGNCCS